MILNNLKIDSNYNLLTGFLYLLSFKKMTVYKFFIDTFFKITFLHNSHFHLLFNKVSLSHIRQMPQAGYLQFMGDGTYFINVLLGKLCKAGIHC